MSAKKKYDERKRLRQERLLREEQRAKTGREHEDDMQEAFMRILIAVERIADVMELWADKQVDGDDGATTTDSSHEDGDGGQAVSSNLPSE